MNRRGLLVGAGCVGLASLSGCLGAVDSLRASDPDVDRQNPPPESIPAEWAQSLGLHTPATAATAVRFGSGADSHWVFVSVESTAPIETRISVRRIDAQPFYQETHTLTREKYVVFEFRQPTTYRIDLSAAGQTASVTVPEEFVDCNDSIQVAVLQENGAVEESSETTQILCA